MSLPRFLRRLFANDGYGPKLRDDIIPYDLCIRVYKTIHPTVIKPGMVPVNGTLLADAATRYPEAWAYLQTEEGQALCVTEEEWQAASKAYWHTNADGTKIGWEGIGGVCKYVINTANGTIRVPDLRGMYEEMAGFDALGVGGTHGDAVRDIVGTIGVCWSYGEYASPPFFETNSNNQWLMNGGNTATDRRIAMDISKSVPTAAKNAPRAWGSLACVYLGLPAS